LKGKEVADDELEREKWKKQIENHKRCVRSSAVLFVVSLKRPRAIFRLVELIHNLLEISLAPSIASGCIVCARGWDGHPVGPGADEVSFTRYLGDLGLPAVSSR
jgi:hypothetical protein